MKIGDANLAGTKLIGVGNSHATKSASSVGSISGGYNQYNNNTTTNKIEETLISSRRKKERSKLC